MTVLNEGPAAGLYRVGGMHGAAYRDGVILTDMVECTVNVEVNRIEVPLVGQTKQGYKPGREQREGTIRIQKVDTRWELEVFQFLTQTLDERRAARGTRNAGLRPFQLQLEFDDPDALGIEKWQLNGCLLWRLPLGFQITDDIIEREYPLTWESEFPLKSYRRTGALDPTSHLPAVEYPTQYNT
jgi:hypothetical protein